MNREFTNDSMVEPTINALRRLGGSGSIQEIYREVVANETITEDEENIPSSDPRRNLISYRMAWARTYLKNVEMIESSARGVWHLTHRGADEKVSASDLIREWRSSHKAQNQDSPGLDEIAIQEFAGESEIWKEDLLNTLQRMDPIAFERLAQRLLREAGFTNVQVTKRTGDGGIDGVGTYKISFLSFPVFFQCKRYSKSVSSPDIRDFRGSLSGRGEKGLFISTGSFTEAAVREASREGVLPIELIDGATLCDLLKEYQVGVHVEKVTSERISVIPRFFDEI